MINIFVNFSNISISDHSNQLWQIKLTRREKELQFWKRIEIKNVSGQHFFLQWPLHIKTITIIIWCSSDEQHWEIIMQPLCGAPVNNCFSENEIKQSIWWPLNKPFESSHLQKHFSERVQLAADVSVQNDTLMLQET